MIGGNPKITLGITYDTIFEYLLELLNRPDFKTKVFEKNREFIHSISINNDKFSETFNYVNNVDFRKFIDDSLQWLLFDYNPYIFNTLLTVINSCFENQEFLKEDSDSFQILFVNLQNKILEKMKENFNEIDDDKKNEIKLLTLILYVLTIPNVTLAVSNLINNNKVVFRKNLTDITCVINKIKVIDIKNNTKVRELITKYFESLKIDRSDINYIELLNLLGKFGDCIPRLLLNLTGKYLVLTGESVSNAAKTYVVEPVQKGIKRISTAAGNLTTVFGRLPFPQ